jgi:hypothetical protein
MDTSHCQPRTGGVPQRVGINPPVLSVLVPEEVALLPLVLLIGSDCEGRSKSAAGGGRKVQRLVRNVARSGRVVKLLLLNFVVASLLPAL